MLESEGRVLGRHPIAVIRDPDDALAPFFEIDTDGGCFSIKRVFDQFLDHGRRSFHDLARSDLMGQDFRQDTDSSHYGTAWDR